MSNFQRPLLGLPVVRFGWGLVHCHHIKPSINPVWKSTKSSWVDIHPNVCVFCETFCQNLTNKSGIQGIFWAIQSCVRHYFYIHQSYACYLFCGWELSRSYSFLVLSFSELPNFCFEYFSVIALALLALWFWRSDPAGFDSDEVIIVKDRKNHLQKKKKKKMITLTSA